MDVASLRTSALEESARSRIRGKAPLSLAHPLAHPRTLSRTRSLSEAFRPGWLPDLGAGGDGAVDNGLVRAGSVLPHLPQHHLHAESQR